MIQCSKFYANNNGERSGDEQQLRTSILENDIFNANISEDFWSGTDQKMIVWIVMSFGVTYEHDIWYETGQD